MENLDVEGDIKVKQTLTESDILHIAKTVVSCGENFKRKGIYVFEATEDEPAKVIALTHLNAYCFEAYR